MLGSASFKRQRVIVMTDRRDNSSSLDVTAAFSQAQNVNLPMLKIGCGSESISGTNALFVVTLP